MWLFCPFHFSSQIFQTFRTCHAQIGNFLKMLTICIKQACKIEHFLFNDVWRGVACSIWKFILKITLLCSKFCLNLGQRFESQTFPVFFRPLWCHYCSYSSYSTFVYLKLSVKALKSQKIHFLSLNFRGGPVQCVTLNGKIRP